MFTRYLFTILLIFACALTAAAQETAPQNVLLPRPIMFADVPRQMNTAAFWITRLNQPDKLILNQSEISALNARVRGSVPSVQNISIYPAKITKTNFPERVNNTINSFLARGRFFTNTGEPLTRNHLQDVISNIDFKALGQPANVRFAMTVKYAHMRVLPTHKSVHAEYFTQDLDRLQASELDIASPLAVLFHTRDRHWFFVEGETAQGWVESRYLAFGTRADIRSFTESEDFVVVIRPKADIYKNKNLTEYFDFVRMGTRLPKTGRTTQNAVEVLVPTRNASGYLVFEKGYVLKEDVSIGYLPYTQRNVITQAFRHINSPYMWGGMHGEQDCSSLLQQIFACFGIILPRNSAAQARCGILAASFTNTDSDEFKINQITRNAIAGISLLHFPGHIMLYLGTENGIPFVIHAIWAYREDSPQKHIRHVINRVAVTSLNLGSDSLTGSLLNRLSSIRIIK